MQTHGVSRAHVQWHPRVLYVCYFTRVDIVYRYAKFDQNRSNRSRVIAGQSYFTPLNAARATRQANPPTLSKLVANNFY